MIAAGKLTRRIQVWALKSSVALSASGHFDETDESNWAIVETRWAQIVPRGSREFFRGQQVAEDITHKIVLRFDSQSSKITTKHRFTLGSRKFNIAGPGINTEEQDITIEFPATEITL